MHANEDQLTIEMEVGRIVPLGEEWGDQLVRHLSLPPGADFPPLLAGLPGDVCDCRAGGLHYWPGGHTGWTDEGVTFPRVQPGGRAAAGTRAHRRAAGAHPVKTAWAAAGVSVV
jgi:hypothetical protein